LNSNSNLKTLQFNSIDITTTCLESNARKWLEEEEEEEEEEIGD
jgi:hypothetical protein